MQKRQNNTSQKQQAQQVEKEELNSIDQVKKAIKEEKLKNIQLENKLISQERENQNQINQLKSQIYLQNNQIKDMQNIIEQLNQSQFVTQLKEKTNKIQQLRYSEIQLETHKSINANLEIHIQNLQAENVNLKQQNDDLTQQVQYLENQLDEIKELAWEAVQEKVAENQELLNTIQQLQTQITAQASRESLNTSLNTSRSEIEDTRKLIEKLNRQNSLKVLQAQSELEADFKSQLLELKDQFLDEITNLEKKISILESEKVKIQQQTQITLEQKDSQVNDALKISSELFQQKVETLERKCEKLEIDKLKLEQRLKQQSSFKSNLKEKYKQSEEEIEQRTIILSSKIDQQNIEIERLKEKLEKQEKKHKEQINKQSLDLEKQNQEFMQIIQNLKQEKFNLESKFQELFQARFSIRPTMFFDDISLANELAMQQSIINRNSKILMNNNLLHPQRESNVKNAQERSSFIQFSEIMNNRQQKKSNPFESQSPENHKELKELQVKVMDLTQQIKNLQETLEITKTNYSQDLQKYLQEIDDLRKELAKKHNVQIALQQALIDKAQLTDSIKQSKQNWADYMNRYKEDYNRMECELVSTKMRLAETLLQKEILTGEIKKHNKSVDNDCLIF